MGLAEMAVLIIGRNRLVECRQVRIDEQMMMARTGIRWTSVQMSEFDCEPDR